MEETRVKIRPSIVQSQFIKSSAFENCIMGPRGEGKTEAGIMAMSWHAQRQDVSFRPIPWAIVRDTWSNIERTTLQSFLQPRPGSFAATIRNRLEIKDGGHRVILPGLWEAWLFGCDSIRDLDKFQSMQLGGVWLEEAAPAANDDIGYGVAEETWLMGLSSLRHPVTTNRRSQITMNYPDEDHWTWLRFFYGENDDRKLFRIPRGENKHIDSQYRQNMALAFGGRPDLMARLVIGQPSQIKLGEDVTPEYKEIVHRSRMVLDPLPGVQVIRFWDGGLHPACVFGQFTPRGRFQVLDTLQGKNIGMKQLIEFHVKPLMALRYQKITSWMDTGDPNLNTPDDSNSDERPAEKIEKLLNTVFIPGEPSWGGRRDAMREILTMMVDGEPAFVISKNDIIMHKVLNGGWHYHKDATGKVLNQKAVKDIYSHPGDALSHGLSMILKTKGSPKERQTVAKTDFDPYTYNTDSKYLNQQEYAESEFNVFER